MWKTKLEIKMTLLNKICSLYNGLLKNHLVLVQSVQTGILCGTGDIIAQTVAEKKSLRDINLHRTGVFVALGSGFIVSLLYYL